MSKRVISLALTVTLLFTVLLSGLAFPVSAATDLLSGGDFEGTLGSGWTWDNHATYGPKYAIINASSPMTVYTEADGNKCLQIPPKSDGTFYDKYYKATPVAAGKTYQLKLRYKGEGLRVYINKEYCSAGQGSFTPAAVTEWTEAAWTFTTKDPLNNKNFIFAIGHVAGSSGNAYIDDVQLFEVVSTESIEFVSKSVSLKKGETETLSLVANPDGAVVPANVTYTSNNTAVATVSTSGVVTAKADGVATITASAGGFTATCTVVVETSPVVNLLVDGDFEAETLSENWSKFVAATANVSFVADPANASNTCMKIKGQKSANYFKLSGAKAQKWYKLTYKAKGTGRLSNTFSYSVFGDYTVLGTENYSFASAGNGNMERVYITPTAEWKEYSIIFKTDYSATGGFNNNYVFYLGGLDSAGEVYYDDVSLVALGTAYTAQGLTGGSLSLSDGTQTGSSLADACGKIVTVTVAPQEGYLLVPGSLSYTTSAGVTKRILNKATGTFGEGDGNSFGFDMPTENVRISAEFVNTDQQSFAWNTVGTSVRYQADGVTTDGVRFLTRINLGEFDANVKELTLTYNGQQYKVKELGQLLKRAANTTELTRENAAANSNATGDNRMWSVTVYSAATGSFRLIDFTEGYVDYTIVMTTKNPSNAFDARLYTTRGYMILEKDGVETVLYADERTDSVNNAKARAEGNLSDDVVIGGGETPEPPALPQVPADDKDYSNADLKILSIGNSFSQDAQGYLAAMAASQGKLFKTVNLYKPGCALKAHYEGMKTGDAIYTYELNGNEKYSSTPVSLAAVLESDQFDVITLQEASWSSVKYSNYQPYLNELIATIRAKQPNATIYLHQTWAYGDANTNHTEAHTGGTMAAMWEKVEVAYAAAAAETGLALIPSGKAIQTAQIELNKGGYSVTSIQRDESHVSKTWGRYLLARVWYQKLMGTVPTVTLNQLNTSVAADADMEALVAAAAAAAFA